MNWRNVTRIGVYSLMIGSLPALNLSAQDADSEEEDLDILESFTITGTRLSGAAMEGSLPVATFGVEDIELSPAQTAEEFLKDLPYVGGPSTVSNNYTNGTDGSTSVGLRNIDGGNTLVLLNGRRITPSGTGSTVDLAQIPLSAVKEIQVLKSGASTVYGTQAVAGVINFIMKDDFEGLDIDLYYGNTEDTDVHQTRASFITGGQGAGGKFSYMVSGTYFEEAALMAPDRDYALGGGHSTYGAPGRFFFGPKAEQAIIDANGFTDADITGSWTLKDGVDIAESPADFTPWINSGQEDGGTRFPYENFTIMNNPVKRYTFYTQAKYEFMENIEAFFELSMGRSEQTFLLAPSPFSGTHYMTTDNYWFQQIFSDAGIDFDDPTDQYWEEWFPYYRFVELGPRINETDRRYLRFVGGLNIKLPANWNLETYWLYSEESNNDSELNGGDSVTFEELVARNDSSAYNMFQSSWIRGSELGGGSFADPSPIADLADLIRADNNTEVLSVSKVFDVEISNDELFELGGDYVGFSGGVEIRSEYALSKPDLLKLNGSIGWNGTSGTTEGDREVMGIYAEVFVPILENLSVTVSGRYEDYEDEFETDVFGINARYQPIADLTLRGSFSQGFVAPTLLDLYNPGFESFPEISDPFYPASDPLRLYQVSVQYQGSQETGVTLEPEESNIYNVGFTYSPSWAEGLDITFDWAKIERNNLIVYSVQGLINEFRDSYSGGNTGSFTEPPANSPYLYENGGPIEYDWNAGSTGENIVTLHGVGPRNVDQATTEWLDLSISYTLPTESMGTFRTIFDSTYYLTMNQTSAISGVTFDYLGEYDGDVAYPELRFSLTEAWSYGDFQFAGTIHWTDSTEDILAGDTGKQEVEAHSEVDLQVSYVLPIWDDGITNTTVTLGVENAFDEDPPVMATAFSNNYPERNYDPRGRYWYIRIKQEF